MLVNAAAQSHFKLDRFEQTPSGPFDSLAPLKSGHAIRKSSGNYHRRTRSCLAVASHHEHYEHPSYFAAVSIDFENGMDGSSSFQSRHAHRKSEGAISLVQLQRSLSGAGMTNVSAGQVNALGGDAKDKKEGTSTSATTTTSTTAVGPLGGKLIKHQPRQPQIHREPCSDSGCYFSTDSTPPRPLHPRNPTTGKRTVISIFTLGSPNPTEALLDPATTPAPPPPVTHRSHPHPAHQQLHHDHHHQQQLRQHKPTFTSWDDRDLRCCRFSNLDHPRSDPIDFTKLNVASPGTVVTPRRSLLSDLINSQASPSRLEQAANRRRLLKSMRRYSVDASEMNFNLAHAAASNSSSSSSSSSASSSSSSSSSNTSNSSSSSNAMLIDSRQEFCATPTVRYLRNPCHAAVKTKLQPSAFKGSLARRAEQDEDGEAPDYFGAQDRVW